ncbi:MAG: zinc-binding dehydrogenase [Pelagibacteraceae bacterium]|jgi:putative PIG3 family NAD(P)H quinone oxidoreductase|nr:zinc-binding dehydrogenase [Pelagibacteraceae bacterium]|tara:strand:- start:1518 stop:2507 length:990 start_codon:yes stop_codon:yes gene_type:complete
MKFVNHNNQGLLFIDERNIETPNPNQVQIEVYSAGVNRADLLQKKGHYPQPEGESDILGLEVSGKICDLGSSVTKYKIGDKVCAILGGGGYAEYVNVDERQILTIPKNISLNDAASLPETILTVYENIFNISGFKKNESVLIHGGSSGIGTTAISILKNFTDKIYVTAGSDEKCKACVELGATKAINYKLKDFEEVLSSDRIKIDVVLDMVGGEYFKKNLKILNFKGRLTYISALGGIKGEINLLHIMNKQLKISGSTLRSRSSEMKGQIVNQVKEIIWPLIEKKLIDIKIFKKFHLDEANEAHSLMESSQHIGKILLTVKEEKINELT